MKVHRFYVHRFTDLTTSEHSSTPPPRLTLATTHLHPLSVSESVPNLTWQHNLRFANMTPISSDLGAPMITLIFHIPFRYLVLGKYSQPYVDIFPLLKSKHICVISCPWGTWYKGSMIEYLTDKAEQICLLK